MEDIIYLPGWWESEFVCHRRNDLDNFKWSFSSGGKCYAYGVSSSLKVHTLE